MLATATFRSVVSRQPRPGVVVGDQLATDGVLAWRVGFSFLHYRPRTALVPLGPRIMNHLGPPTSPIAGHPIQVNPDHANRDCAVI